MKLEMIYTEEEFKVAKKKVDALKFPEVCDAEIEAYDKYLAARKTWESARGKMLKVWNLKEKITRELCEPKQKK